MPNFSIAIQIKKELEDFKKSIRIVHVTKAGDAEAVRYAASKKSEYDHNLADTVNLIDLYSNSQFESGAYDNQRQRKMFMNVGNFRAEIASKQIQIATKDGRFYPADFADPYMAFFMQKDYHEWAKESAFAELINTWEDKLPSYGTIVGKEMGNREIVDLPLQNIVAMDQSALSIAVSSHFIEAHPKMRSWEIQAMRDWDLSGLTLRYDEEYDVYERSGFVPKAWLDKQNNVTDPEARKDDGTYVDAKVIGMWPKNDRKKDFHVFFAEVTNGDRGYREAHWNRHFGRWLGVGVKEDLIENQRAKNTVTNLKRKSMQWASKRVSQSASTDMAAKNLSRDVQDGEILEVGVNGEIKPVIFDNKTGADFQTFMNEWEQNSDQKAFTYDVVSGDSTGTRTMTATVGVLLSKATASYYSKKREAFGLFLKGCVIDFEVPKFLRDMDNLERVLTLFPDETGYEVLKEAAMAWVRSEACRISMFSGKPVDPTTLTSAIQPWEAASMLFATKKKGAYKNANSKFDLDFTQESIDIEKKLQSLQTLYQLLVQKGDPRAEGVLTRIAQLAGESMAAFGPKGVPVSTGNPQPNATATPSTKAPAAASV
jgi:hypothetical protein